MKETEYKVAGYSFTDAYAYKEAKREVETVDYIRANTDLTDLNKAVKLYQKLIERKTLNTVVGYGFLKELQERILKEGILSQDNIPGIPVVKEEKQIKSYKNSLDHENEKRHQEILEEYKIKLKNSRIISLFLVVIIIAMLIISFFGGHGVVNDKENEIINNYSAWKEELEAREKALEEREADISVK